MKNGHITSDAIFVLNEFNGAVRTLAERFKKLPSPKTLVGYSRGAAMAIELANLIKCDVITVGDPGLRALTVGTSCVSFFNAGDPLCRRSEWYSGLRGQALRRSIGKTHVIRANSTRRLCRIYA